MDKEKEEVVNNDENIETVNQEIQKDNSEYEELNDRYKRLFAEFENYKKRSQKEKESIYGMITGDVVSSMLPVMDNLEKAAEAKSNDTQYQDGVKLVDRKSTRLNSSHE